MQKEPEGEGKEDHEMFPNKRRDLRFKAIPERYFVDTFRRWA